MKTLIEMVKAVKDDGYSEISAEAKVCQDIVLSAISQSSLSRNVTIKGGVVMRSITGNVRRATQDLDLDFIRYSLSEDSIREFIQKLNCLEGIKIQITGQIEELSQQEYKGKRVRVILSDSKGNSFVSKIDFGVHTHFEIEQDEYCFDVCLDDSGASLLINSKEQIFAEKLRSLLRLGTISTRYKDIFDLCYLSDYINKDLLKPCLSIYIYGDLSMKENDLKAILRRIDRIFQDKTFRKKIESSQKNWLEISVPDAFNKIKTFLESI